MKNESAKLLFVFVAISMIIGSSCYVMSVKGQIAFLPDPPIKVWIDVSPNPAYSEDTIHIRGWIGAEDESLYNKTVEVHIAIFSPQGYGKITAPPASIMKIPTGLGLDIQASKVLSDVMEGNSGEYIVQIQPVIKDVGKFPIPVEQKSFYIYNHSREPEKPYLLLEKQIKKVDLFIETTIKIENIGTGNARNVELKDSLLPDFNLIRGSLSQKYEYIRQNEYKTHNYVFMPSEGGLYSLDSATATYEDSKGNSYSSVSNPFQLMITGKPPVILTPSPIPSLTTTPTPAHSPSPTPKPSPTPIIEKKPAEQFPPPTPAPPDNGDGWLIFIISAIALVSIAVLFKPMMLKYYEWKMKKWEEGYDVSKLKEVLKK